MPYYPYKCMDCKKQFEIFLSYDEYDNASVACPHCQSGNVERKVLRIRIARSEESRMEDLTDPAALDGLEDDPKALGKMMRKMSGEMGEDMGPEFDEVIDRLERGQSPDEIENAMPDLADSADSPTAGGLDGF